ncbi:hypothetical protein TEQG_00268 [Trichophyton equinum CBS 127.97]|uniref:Uncharacterized protein n=1 Tax=Trichophyton equinum (strain ATCC MYA-4606 / CBS 127.97) TaxID=559882 RepID=F2PH47_TRIEC|nr:hypothetical protein TEQG_00268 [Trichophyton equinum CBS 127.97]
MSQREGKGGRPVVPAISAEWTNASEWTAVSIPGPSLASSDGMRENGELLSSSFVFLYETSKKQEEGRRRQKKPEITCLSPFGTLADCRAFRRRPSNNFNAASPASPASRPASNAEGA